MRNKLKLIILIASLLLGCGEVSAMYYPNPGVTSLPSPHGGGAAKGTRCPSGQVPVDSATDSSYPDSVSGNVTCVPHNYYSSDNYTLYAPKGSGIVNCYGEDAVVNYSGNYIECSKWDDVSPIIANIGEPDPANGSQVVQHPNFNVTLTATNGGSGSPITRVEGYFEDYNSVDSYLPSAFITNNGTLDIYPSTDNVSNDPEPDGTRIYSFKVTRVCDEAMNCIQDNNGLRVFTYKVIPSSGPENVTSLYPPSPTTGTSCGPGRVPPDAETDTNEDPENAPFTCTNHNYYSSHNYQINVPKDSGIINCNGEDRVVNASGGRITCSKWDDIIPKQTDLRQPSLASGYPRDGDNLLANSSQNFQVIVDDHGEAPITRIEGLFENYNQNDFSRSTAIPFSSNTNPATFTFSTQNIDNDRGPNGGREYTMRITKICDEAGNCLCEPGDTDPSCDDNTLNKFYTYMMYANTANLGSLSVPLKGVQNPNNIADGTESTVRLALHDAYGNDIVPSTVASGGIDRRVNFRLNVGTSNLHLNQYNQSGGSSVFVKSPTTTYTNTKSGVGTQVYTNETPTATGDYDFKFKVYSPTYKSSATNGQQYANGSYEITNIRFDVAGDDLGVSGATFSNRNINNSGLVFDYKPLYKAEFGNDGVNRDGFIEGAIQNTTLASSKNTPSTLNPGGKELRIEYGGSDASYRNDSYNLFNPSSKVAEGKNPSSPSKTVESTSLPSSKTIRTRLVQEEGFLVDPNTKSYLATVVRYLVNTDLGQREVIYTQDVVGKNRYDGSFDSTNNTAQSGIMVEGTTSSSRDNSGYITTAQGSEVNYVAGSIEKSSIKNFIVKNAHDFTRGVQTSNGSRIIDDLNFSNDEAGREIMNGSILYFGDLAGSNVTLDRSASNSLETITFNGNKTIIVKGGNLYIKSNIVKSNSSSILGIVVIEDENGNGGNIYINPDVTKINATMYAEKSLMSYDGTSTMGGGTNQYELKNQLYIKGSIFSENTIGGARQNPVSCPYYVNAGCDESEAQKYDLNFLRRYFIATDGNPANGGATNYSSADPNYQYPLVIEYDSTLQVSPPPVFEEN